MVGSISVKKWSLVLAFLKPIDAIYQVEPAQLPEECIYLSRDYASGWWCCPSQSIPVEIFRGQGNMTSRAYAYVREECATFFASANSTLATTLDVSEVSSAALIVGVLLCFVFIVICLLSGMVQLRRYQGSTPSRSSPTVQPPRFSNYTRALSTLVDDTRDADLPNLVAEVEAASARLSRQVERNRERATGESPFGRACSTFNPGRRLGGTSTTSGVHAYEMVDLTFNSAAYLEPV